jgi:coenzyme Q-binding protein COQ10
MSEINSQRHVNADTSRVYAAAKRVTDFPEVLSSLDSVEVLEDDGAGHTVTRWVGTISVGPLTRRVSWTERDVWEDTARSCSFTLIEGDMKQYDGEWTFTPSGTGCDVKLRVDFEMGIPVLGPLINKMVDQVMQHTCDELLEALEKLAAR